MVALVAALVAASPAWADRRIALVIGNGAYSALPTLPNPRKEAVEIGEALKRLGYQATIATDLDKKAMNEVIETFAASAREADVALFYYSGHGYQTGGENFLVSIDSTLASDSDLISSIRLTNVVRSAAAKLASIFILDCNRDNPFPRGVSGQLAPSTGFAEPAPGKNIFIGYSTSTGKVAEDGGDGLSPFAAAFLRHLDRDEDIAALFKRITDDVNKAADGRQKPDFYGSLGGTLVLRQAH